ncbi:MAG: cytidylate kinase-like family protein [Gemmatimonadota bacterium]|nr:cytidylate kinase-like family protein [Gemmatimonadota bacterium]
MGVITVSREYGSDGRSVAQKAADRLGYLCMNKDLLVEVANEAQVPVSEAERFDERPEHPAMRVVRKFLTPGHPEAITGLSEYEWWATATVPELTGRSVTVPHLPDEEAFVNITREVVTRLADRDNVVLVGRGGQALLRDRPDTLHLRVVAPIDYRIQVVMDREDLASDAAAKRIRKMDENRKRYLKRHYGIAWHSSENYHLTLNSRQTGIEGAASIVAEAMRYTMKARRN